MEKLKPTIDSLVRLTTVGPPTDLLPRSVKSQARFFTIVWQPNPHLEVNQDRRYHEPDNHTARCRSESHYAGGLGTIGPEIPSRFHG